MIALSPLYKAMQNAWFQQRMGQAYTRAANEYDLRVAQVTAPWSKAPGLTAPFRPFV